MSAIDSVLMAFEGVFGNETEEELMNTVEYKEYGFSIKDCPICKSKTMDTFWICSACGWEYDLFIDYKNDDEFSDCNGATLGEYKNVYRILRDIFEQRKLGNTENLFLITFYRKDFDWDVPNEHSYGAFDSFDSCNLALNENLGNMHDQFFDFAVVLKIDSDSHVEEMKWFIWGDEKQGFFATEKEVDWSSGWVSFD